MTRITPWTRFCIENRIDRSNEQCFRDPGFLITKNGGITCRKVEGMGVSTLGLKLETSGASGYFEEEFAWDELDNWSHNSPNWHTWSWSIECNSFRLIDMSDVACGTFYNMFISFSCPAFYAVSRRFPMMRSGAFLGYMDPGARSLFDASGFPSQGMVGAILKQLPS